MKLELRRVSVWSVMKISFLVHLVMGFLVGLVYAAIIGLIALAPMRYGARDFGADLPIAVGGIVLILMPIFFAGFAAVVNTIAFAICTLIYNLAARLFGGLELELTEVLERSVVQPAQSTPPPPESTPGAGETI